MIQSTDLQFLGRAGVNYLLNPGAETGRQGWSLFTTTFSASGPTTITPGAADCTLTSSTTVPLRGTRSLAFAVTSAIGSIGQGFISDVFTVDNADLAKVLTAAFDYNFSAGGTSVDVSGTSTQTLEIWVYNVGLAAWTQPAGFRGINQNSLPGYVAATFQTDSSNASNKNQYRIAVIIKNAPSGSFTMQVDQAVVGPQPVVYGAPVTDWVAYTPTFSAGFGTPTGVNFWYRRVGDSVQVRGIFTAGTTTATTATVSLPAGFSVDATKNPSRRQIGVALYQGTSGQGWGVFAAANATAMTFGGFSGSNNPGTDVAGNVMASSGFVITLDAEVQVNGWSSTVQMSNDTDTRVVAANLASGTATLGAAFSDVSFTVIRETHGAFGTTTYTVPVSGFYSLVVEGRFSSSGVITATNAIGFQFLVDGSSVKDGSDAFLTTVAQWSRLSHQVFLNAGQTVKVQARNQNTNPTFSVAPTFNIQRLSGPSAIAATETVAARYISVAGQSITNGSTATVVYDTLVFDTHGSYNNSTGIFTAPVSGKYLVVSQVRYAAGTYALGTSISIFFEKGISGVYTEIGAFYWDNTNSTFSRIPEAQLAITVQLNAGETFRVRTTNSLGATVSLAAGTAGRNHLDIVRVGN